MPLLDYLNQLIAAPVSAGGTTRARRIALLNIILSIILVALPILILVNIIDKYTPVVVMILNSLFVLCCFVMRQAIQRNYENQVSVLLVLLSYAYVTAAVSQLGTIRSPTTAAYVVVIIGAGLLFEWRGLVALVGLCSCTVWGLIWAENNGWLPKPDYAVGLSQWSAYTLVFSAVGVAIMLAFQAFQQALSRMDAELNARLQSEEKLLYLSTHDTLTGIYNRAFFETEMDRLSASRDLPISLLVTDLDDMKMTNDTLGHAVGDELLRCAARVLQSSMRASDILARIGGDEFAVLLPHTDAATAEQVVKRIRKQLDALNRIPGILPLSLSLGMATLTNGDLRDTFKLADAQMYADKHQHKAMHLQN